LLACDVDVILEEELQRQPSQHQRLRPRRGENAEDDDEPQREQIALGDFCPRAGVSPISGFICILNLNRFQAVDWASRVNRLKRRINRSPRSTAIDSVRLN
jgi:hypothetical protein